MRVVILALLSFCTISTLAQDNYLEQRIGWRQNQIELHSITDKAKQQNCTVVVGVDSIRAFVTDNQLQILQQFYIARLPKDQILGGFFSNGRIYLFTESDTYNELRRWELDIATGKTAIKFIPFDLKDEKVVDRISAGDHFMYFTVDKKTSEFIIYDFNQGNEHFTLRYKFDEGVWENLTNSFFKRSINVEKVDLEGNCSLDVAVHKNKIYLYNDKLFLVMNNYIDSTQVFSFDLQQKKVDYRLIKHGSGGPSAENISTGHNSFLLRDKLYYVRATYNSLLLEVVDLNSGAVLQTYVAGKDDPISFKNSPVMQEKLASGAKPSRGKAGQLLRKVVTGDVGTQRESVSSTNTSRELERTSQLLRKMVHGNVVITATPVENSQIQLMIGAYDKITGNNNYTTYMPTGAPGSGGGTWIPAGGFSRTSWTQVARFKTLLDGNTYEHIGGNAGYMVSERIEKYTEEIKVPPQAENLFMLNGHYYYAFYDKNGRRLVILEF